MKFYKLSTVVLFAILSVACFWSEETPNANSTMNPNLPANQPANNLPNTNEVPAANNVVTQPETEVIPKTEEIKSLKTPTEAFRTFTVAAFNKDVEAVKQSISKESLKFIEASAKQQNKTVAELLTGGAVKETTRKIPEVRNEKIEGDRATIEVKNEMGAYNKIPLVKENGEWKIALDELSKEAQKKFEEMQKRLSETN